MMAFLIHHIDPVAVQVGSVGLWWYGLSYVSGFLSLHLWLRRARHRLGFSMADVYRLTLFIVAGVLLGGRLVEVFFYEWPFYSQHLHLIPAVWLGGMATHGLLFGAVLSSWLYSRLYRVSFLTLLDELAVPGAIIMGLGRIGNFIDGQILGSVTNVWWGVKFPDAEGFRHPVVLYDGLKNLMLVPLLLWLRHRGVRRGILTANYIFWYGFLRIFVDLFREYPTTLLGLATGQSFNLLMAVVGGVLFAWSYRRNVIRSLQGISRLRSGEKLEIPRKFGMTMMKGALVVLLLLCATMPSDWTQDVPARYGKRHPGLRYSIWYPHILARTEFSTRTLPRHPTMMRTS
jgi:phosphatidylglycerol---prolipoprotein diacylglyceryl transferase